MTTTPSPLSPLCRRCRRVYSKKVKEAVMSSKTDMKVIPHEIKPHINIHMYILIRIIHT
jgi:hypothetical protein